MSIVLRLINVMSWVPNRTDSSTIIVGRMVDWVGPMVVCYLSSTLPGLGPIIEDVSFLITNVSTLRNIPLGQYDDDRLTPGFVKAINYSLVVELIDFSYVLGQKLTHRSL